MRFEELNWFDIEKYLTLDDRLIIIIGACEQHGYLSLATDVSIPQALADAASQQTGVLVAPSVNFGASPYFLDYPGTLSLRLSTLMDLVEDIIRSAHGHGFQRILVLNGHGGNDGVRGRLYELANQLADLKIAWYAWWQSHSVQAIAAKHELKPAHANWLEAFPFTMVSDLPGEEKIPPRVEGILNAGEAKRVYEDGVFGGAYQTDASIMEEIFNAAVEDILQILKFET
ncbi:MAG: creatininase family protein [Anaerolineales bacterium]